MANENASLTDLLTEALTRSQALVKQVEEQNETIDRLFRQCAERDIEIASLKKSLRVSQAKEKKWRLEHPALSSPVMSDELDPSERTSRSTTPRLPVPKPAAPKSSPHIQVASSPPAKRRRLEARDTTPLREVVNSKPLERNQDRVQRAIKAIPTVAEDGDWDTEPVSGGREKKPASERHGAENRLGALLDAPAAHSNAALPRPVSTSPKPQMGQPPTLQQSSSDSALAEKAPLRRRPPFLPPSVAQQQDKKPLRSQRPSSLRLSDFVPRPEYLGEWERPRAHRRAHMEPDQASDEEVLLWYLGAGGKEKLATMTRKARDNLLHDARLKKMATRIAEGKGSVEQGGNGQGFWNIDFPTSQEEQKNRREQVQTVVDEVQARFDEAVTAGGRWLFRDEASAT
jgi:hypothetical protein